MERTRSCSFLGEDRARLVDGRYAEPESLSFNSEAHDLDPIVAPDGSFLVFTSMNRPGAPGRSDLYVSFHQDGAWSEPVDLGPGINTAFSEGQAGISPDGNRLFFASNRVPAPNSKTRVDYAALVRELRGIHNGLLNIYEVDAARVRALRTKR